MSTDEQVRFMWLALAEARKAFAEGEVPVGAVVVSEGTVIGIGHNQRETLSDPTAHAEIIAIRDAARRLGGWRLEGSTVYATVEPCAMCAGALVQARVDRLVYGCVDPKAGAIDSICDLVRNERFNHQLTVVGGVLADECADIMRMFFLQLRKGG